MLRPRIIPCLLVREKGLVKTVGFREARYVGDPINVVRIFNEKEVDELIVLDIDATVKGVEPDYRMIEHLASECRMPLCYGGGIKTEEQARRIFGLGVEKIAMSSAAVESPGLIAGIAEKVGTQSVVVVIDVRRNAVGSYEACTHNATRRVEMSPFDLAIQAERMGAGELVINSVERDGTMKGYDLELIEAFRDRSRLPMTAVGGAGSLADFEKLIRACGMIGSAAGSLFVFKGPYRAVLISYPSRPEKRDLIERSGG